MFLVRIDHARDTGQPLSMWLKTVLPVRLSGRDQAMAFLTKGDAQRAAGTAKLIGWTLETA